MCLNKWYEKFESLINMLHADVHFEAIFQEKDKNSRKRRKLWREKKESVKLEGDWEKQSDMTFPNDDI